MYIKSRNQSTDTKLWRQSSTTNKSVNPKLTAKCAASAMLLRWDGLEPRRQRRLGTVAAAAAWNGCGGVNLERRRFPLVRRTLVTRRPRYAARYKEKYTKLVGTASLLRHFLPRWFSLSNRENYLVVFNKWANLIRAEHNLVSYMVYTNSNQFSRIVRPHREQQQRCSRL
jgi:hypothetical protein